VQLQRFWLRQNDDVFRYEMLKPTRSRFEATGEE